MHQPSLALGPIKALSLWQPWASLIARGVKRHETRGWPTSYRGPIAIHAAKTLDRVGAPHPLCRAALNMHWPMCDLPRSAIVAVGEVASCMGAQDVDAFITRADLVAGDFSAGRYAWGLTNVRALYIPIPLAGRQGLFNWTPPADLERRLGPVIDHAGACRAIGWADQDVAA